MIKAFIFDLGNVLYTFDITKTRNFLMKNTHALNPLIFMKIKKILARYEHGEISTSEFFDLIKEQSGYKGTFGDFRSAFCEIFEENPDSIPVVKKIIRKYPAYILSNTNRMHAEYLEKTFPLLHEFRGQVYSFETGFMKPNPEIYKLAIKRFQLNPEETLFIDDLKDNVLAAEKTGLMGLYYPVKNGKSQISLEDELTKRNVML